MVRQIAGALPGSYSVNFSEEFVYNFSYDYRFRTKPDSRWRWMERMVAGPLLLGRLMNRAAGFIYVASTGFLLSNLDQREFEFSYVKRKGLPIICYWCGSDIRSTKRMHALEKETGLPNISTYIGERGRIYDSEEWDEQKRAIAEVASRHASAMFSNTVDHLSYLTVGTEPFLYFLPDDPLPNPGKFEDLSTIVIVHATTAPSIKGTPLVRAAIHQLREEGYEFEYVELIGVPNATVKHELGRAHIAMNQFYGFSPAVFGVEALAAGCVVMMSADEFVETDLPAGSNECWVVTKHHQVYANLKRLLDDPSQLEPIARRGRAWAEKYASRASAGALMRRTLDAVLDGSYQAPAVRP
ncbi:MAG: glycosyltransferase family 1 protein [Cryobacterium sp.]|nr:glycosyltransferase family 1 protein [Cryobacterium sp.]